MQRILKLSTLIGGIVQGWGGQDRAEGQVCEQGGVCVLGGQTLTSCTGRAQVLKSSQFIIGLIIFCLLRFGDQILQVNGENLAGYSSDKVHGILKKVSVNNIVMAVRDRPFERALTLHKVGGGCDIATLSPT